MCFLARYGVMEHGDPMPSCEGRLIRAHLIDKQELKRRGLNPDDPATWVMACGGPMGNGGHHGMFDGFRLRLPASALPERTAEYARHHGLEGRLRRFK